MEEPATKKLRRWRWASGVLWVVLILGIAHWVSARLNPIESVGLMCLCYWLGYSEGRKKAQ